LRNGSMVTMNGLIPSLNSN